MNRSQGKPLITFGLMAHNDARFIREALAAAFAQLYEPLEIIVSDDCSSDGTAVIIERTAAAYRGPHSVVVNRNEGNLGVSRHINRVMELSHGEIVVIAAGDDVSLPHRVQRIYEAFRAAQGQAFSIHSSCLLINDRGERIGTAQEYESYEADLESVIEAGTWLYGCTHAWRRDVFDRFGPLPAEVMREDEVLPFRSLLLGVIGYVREPLVLYRLHEKNLSRGLRRVARDRRDLNDLISSQLCERVVNLKSYLSDLEKAGDLLDPERCRAIRDRLIRELENRELDLILRKGNLKRKVEMLLQNGKGLSPLQTARALLRILFPETYLHYSYLRYNKAACSTVEAVPLGGEARRAAVVEACLSQKA